MPHADTEPRVQLFECNAAAARRRCCSCMPVPNTQVLTNSKLLVMNDLAEIVGSQYISGIGLPNYTNPILALRWHESSGGFATCLLMERRMNILSAHQKSFGILVDTSIVSCVSGIIYCTTYSVILECCIVVPRARSTHLSLSNRQPEAL